jgi:diaminopimelate epimerase
MSLSEFYKLTGSGNDFVFFDIREGPNVLAASRDFIPALCARGTGVGADGVVFFSTDPRGNPLIVYLNADGSPAALCGNATLCTVRLASILGFSDELTIRIGGQGGGAVVTGRLVDDQPEIDLAPVAALVVDQPVTVRPPIARRIGFAVAGVPHLVVLVDDVATVDVASLGAPLRRDPTLGPEGANVNFVTPSGRMRTYERGVEGETLACGTGAVVTAAVLVAWGLATSPVSLTTASGSVLTVTLGPSKASLAGEGRLVFTGRLSESAVRTTS